MCGVWSSQLGCFKSLAIHKPGDKYVLVGIWQVGEDMISELVMPPVEEQRNRFPDNE